MKASLLILIFTLTLFSQGASAKVWKLVTLEWPPHVCSHCPDGGIGLKFVKELFKRSGETLEITYLPWKRAKKEFEEGDFDLIYPLWIWEYEKMGQKTIPYKIYHSQIIMVKNPKSKEPFCLVDTYNYGPKVNSILSTGIEFNQTARSDEQCIKQIQNGRSSGTLVDRTYLDYESKHGFNLKPYELSDYDQGDLYLGFQKKDNEQLTKLFAKNLIPFQKANQEEFEKFISNQK